MTPYYVPDERRWDSAEGTPNKYEAFSSDCVCLIIIPKHSCNQHIFLIKLCP